MNNLIPEPNVGKRKSKADTGLTEAQMSVIRCAFADLCGSMQVYLQDDITAHDWRAHMTTILELQEAFDFVGALPPDLDDGDLS
jgi:hypothetical protein